MVLFSAGGDFLQEAGPAGRPPPEPDPGGALEEILRDRRAGPAFLRWYSDDFHYVIIGKIEKVLVKE